MTSLFHRSQAELKIWKQKYRLMQMKTARQRTKLERSVQKQQSELEKVSTLFTVPQLDRLRGKRTPWSTPDIQKSLAVMSTSKRAYKMLRASWNLPLPSERTLQAWMHKFELYPGVIRPVLELLRELATGMTNLEKVCTLSFDEMSVSGGIDWDKSTDTVYGSHSKVQVAMLTGIFSTWKQPIYFDFDQKMSNELLFRILDDVSATGLRVKAMVSDLGGTNRELLNKLGITPENSSFKHGQEDIHVFADMPHMIKLLRNHLLDTGWETGRATVSKATLQKMIMEDSQEIRLHPKLTFERINLIGAERMRVAPAAQVFSSHSATLASIVFPDNPGIQEFFQTIDNLFDVFNSHQPNENAKLVKSGFGLKLNQQMECLDKAYGMISGMRCKIRKDSTKQRKELLPCQRGILLSINSLKRLYRDLKENFGITYILTRRLNQDPLESFFSIVRALGRTNDNPSPSSFNSRMKILLFGSKLKAPKSSNVEFHEDHVTFATSRLIKMSTDPRMANEMGSNQLYLESHEPSDDHEKGDSAPLPDIDEVGYSEDALFYLAGYIASALKRKHKMDVGTVTGLASNPPNVGANWLLKLSRGGLMIPSQSLHKDIQDLEKSFNCIFTMEKLIGEKNISDKVSSVLQTRHKTIQEVVIREYVKVRIKIRIKSSNDAKRNAKFGKVTSRKNTRKSKQFINSHI